MRSHAQLSYLTRPGLMRCLASPTGTTVTRLWSGDLHAMSILERLPAFGQPQIPIKEPQSSNRVGILTGCGAPLPLRYNH